MATKRFEDSLLSQISMLGDNKNSASIKSFLINMVDPLTRLQNSKAIDNYVNKIVLGYMNIKLVVLKELIQKGSEEASKVAPYVNGEVLDIFGRADSGLFCMEDRHCLLEVFQENIRLSTFMGNIPEENQKALDLALMQGIVHSGLRVSIMKDEKREMRRG